MGRPHDSRFQFYAYVYRYTRGVEVGRTVCLSDSLFVHKSPSINITAPVTEVNRESIQSSIFWVAWSACPCDGAIVVAQRQGAQEDDEKGDISTGRYPNGTEATQRNLKLPI